MANISLQHLDKIYDNKVQAVFDFNLEVKDGELIVLVGPSGCGKSTTLRMIAGLEDISAGKLLLDGKDITTAPAKDYDWSDCVKSGTQGNAAAWLYEPIVCAANILIVPRTRVLTTTRAKFARDTSNGILPQWRALQVNWAGLFDIDLGSCHGYRFGFGWNGIKIFDDAEVLNACPGQQLDFLPKISCAVITLLLCIVAVMICRKAFMAIFDYHPGGDGGEA